MGDSLPPGPPPRERRAGRWSLRIRLALWVVVVNTLILWTAISIFWLYQRSAIEQVHNSRRLAHAIRLAHELDQVIPGAGPQRVDDITKEVMMAFFYDRYQIEVFRANGDPLFKERPPRIDALRAGVVQGMLTALPVVREDTIQLSLEPDARPEPTRIVTIAFAGRDDAGYAVTLMTGDSYMIRQLAVARGALLLCGIVGPVGSAVGAWFIAGIAVAPFESLRRLATSLMPDASGAPVEDGSFAASPEVRRLAAELDEARRRVAERFEAQERFISNVSHELKTPISVTLTEAQTLDRSGLSPKGLEFVESVEEEMSRLGRLVESFLTLSRIQDGKGPSRFRPYALNDLVIDSIDNCRKMADQYRVRLVPTLLADEDTLDIGVLGEHELLCNMVDNLVRNAIRFSPEHSPVHVIAGAAEGVATITVRDSGPGIPADRIGVIFDRFSQASNQPRRGRGHGLGLTIAKGIAELHGGTIRVANLPEKGCEFIVSLPIRPAGDKAVWAIEDLAPGAPATRPTKMS